MLLELAEVKEINLWEKLKRTEKRNNAKKCLENKFDILTFLKQVQIPIKDFLVLLRLYKNCSLIERKVFEQLENYTMILSLYENITNFSWNHVYPEIINSFMKANNTIVDYAKKLEKEKKNNQKKIRAIDNICEKRITILKHCTPDTYLEITEEELQYFPDKLLEEMEIKFLEHNEKLMHELEIKYRNKPTNRKQEIYELLMKFQIQFTEEELNILVNSVITCEVIEKRLKKYKEIDLTEILKILSLEQESFELLINLLTENVVSIDFLKKYIENITKEKIVKMQETYFFLKNIGITTKYLDEVLFWDQNDIESQFTTAQMYQLKSYDGIFKPHFFDMLDIWIEQGFYSCFNQNPEIIDLDFINITKRMIIGQKIGLTLFKEDGKLLPKFLEEKKFFIKDEELLEYIENRVPTLLEERKPYQIAIESLETYCENSYTYNIAGVKISKPKVIRNLSSGLEIENAIFYGSILDVASCKSLQNELANIRNLSYKNVRNNS